MASRQRFIVGAVEFCTLVHPPPHPSPTRAGLSHMENPESDPRLGGMRRSAAAATPWNRIANRPESKHELRLCPFGACSSGQLLARKFLPYAIPLPLRGRVRVGGRNIARF